jgi:hypothetical protein
MTQKDLMLVGGGLIAGYVICKMMNRNASTESFSADGQRAQGAETMYKWNGGGSALMKRGSLFNQQIIPADTTFRLTGNTKYLNKIISPLSQQWSVSTSGKGTKYVESTFVFTKTLASGQQLTSRIWFPADSVTQI